MKDDGVPPMDPNTSAATSAPCATAPASAAYDCMTSGTTCASLLLAQNVHPRVVMEILGHSGIAITMDTYSHVLPELQREAADRMDQALGYTDRNDEDEEPPQPDLGTDGA